LIRVTGVDVDEEGTSGFASAGVSLDLGRFLKHKGRSEARS
jgi:hypothetical protein